MIVWSSKLMGLSSMDTATPLHSVQFADVSKKKSICIQSCHSWNALMQPLAIVISHRCIENPTDRWTCPNDRLALIFCTSDLCDHITLYPLSSEHTWLHIQIDTVMQRGSARVSTVPVGSSGTRRKSTSIWSTLWADGRERTSRPSLGSTIRWPRFATRPQNVMENW